MLGFSVKLYLKISRMSTTSDSKVIFIILIIILNLYDPSLTGFDCNTRPRALDVGLAARSCHKSVIIKKKKFICYRIKLKKIY